MIKISNIKIDIPFNLEDLKNKCERLIKRPITNLKLIKKSVDARDKDHIYFVCTVLVTCQDEHLAKLKDNTVFVKENKFVVPISNTSFDNKPIIVGAGPAGLFAAYTFIKSGIPCILIEQGKKIENRIKDIDNLINNGILNPISNIQFGEGGAGTFSDGKLTTSSKDEKLRFILETFVNFGAPKEILYDAKPHIGTDILRKVIVNMRNYLLDNNCTILFETKCTKLLINDNKIIGIEINNEKEIKSDIVILAIGHSARDTYEMLHEQNVLLEQKSFAMGVRIEHLQKDIQASQYGKYANDLDPTDYKLAVTLPSKRNVYSFCVCPGGEVMASASEENTVVTNGMSEYKRDKENINGALLVNVNPSDFNSDHPLSGIYFQRKWEQKAFEAGNNYYAPAQLLKDFIENKPSKKLGKIKPSYKPGVVLTNLKDYLPAFIYESIKEAIPIFSKKVKGFDNQDSILTAIESRSSSPVRIVRSKNYESVNIKGIYPIGEGAGYAGGIVTSAIDGVNCILNLIK